MPTATSSKTTPMSERKEFQLWREICYHQFPLPPCFKEDGWRLIHSDCGKYCQLDQMNGWHIWMGNGEDEQKDMYSGACKMHGDCLVLGLGIGLIIQYIDYLQVCKSITVVEKSSTVIKHIDPWLRSVTNTPLEIVLDDDEHFMAHTEKKWDTMFADTWIKCIDELEKIDRLKALSRNHIRGTKIYWAEKYLRRLK